MPPLTLLVLSDPRRPHLRLLERLPDSTNVIVTDDPEHIARRAPEADVILTGPNRGELIEHAFSRASRLRWMHSLSAGVENQLSPEVVASEVPLTNGRGVFARPLAEWTIAATLHFAYDLRRMVRQQEEGRWEQFDIEELHDRAIGVVGYGAIGKAVAERARPFGARILALRRRPELAEKDSLVDAAYSPDRIVEMAAASDYLICTAPLTPETRGLVGEAVIGALKPNAVVMNVGRGAVIDEAALIRALQAGTIRGAALDVFEQEPLPAGHPFFKLPNVLLSPHCADHTPGWVERAVELFLQNFSRFTRGEPLENIVDKHAGY